MDNRIAYENSPNVAPNGIRSASHRMANGRFLTERCVWERLGVRLAVAGIPASNPREV